VTSHNRCFQSSSSRASVLHRFSSVCGWFIHHFARATSSTAPRARAAFPLGRAAAATRNRRRTAFASPPPRVSTRRSSTRARTSSSGAPTPTRASLRGRAATAKARAPPRSWWVQLDSELRAPRRPPAKPSTQFHPQTSYHPFAPLRNQRAPSFKTCSPLPSAVTRPDECL
jgi:hypothetical protein